MSLMFIGLLFVIVVIVVVVVAVASSSNKNEPKREEPMLKPRYKDKK